MSYETLLTDVHGGVCRITLNRPDVRNALPRTTVGDIESAVTSFEADPGARDRGRNSGPSRLGSAPAGRWCEAVAEQSGEGTRVRAVAGLR